MTSQTEEAIDWTEVKQIQSALEFRKTIRSAANAEEYFGSESYNDPSNSKEHLDKVFTRLQHVVDMFDLSLGAKIHLELEVTNPALAQIVIESMYSHESLVPGMKIQSFTPNPEVYKRNTLIAELRQLVDELEQRQV